jgi:hypothetical protein
VTADPAVCDIARDDAGLIAAVLTGLALARPTALHPGDTLVLLKAPRSD